MKLTLLIFNSFLLLTMGITYGQSLETYENPLLGFKFQYPSEWNVGYEGADGVGFYLPNNQSNIRDLLAIGIDDNKGIKDLREYFRKSFFELDAPVNYSTLKLTETSLSSLPAMNASFFFNDGRNSETVYAIKDNEVYSILYSAEPNTYSNHLAEVNNIIKSFQITG